MQQGWQTRRGDEWWYEDTAIRARGYPASDGSFSFEVAAKSAMFGLPASQLLAFLAHTRAQFPHEELLCYIDRVTLPLLEELASSGQLEWAPRFAGSRDAKIIGIGSRGSAT